MQTLKDQFIDFALSQQILKFGQFTLKSGRISPYFFNAGLFYSGAQLSKLGEFYSQTLLQSQLSFDVLFGPAYKGLPLATSTAIALFQQGVDINVAFNRKEQKTHGEQGILIGAPLQGKKVVIIDDVITAGTAFKEAKKIIEDAGGQLAGLIIALNRQEVGVNQRSAIEEIKQNEKIPVLSIISLTDIMDYLNTKQLLQELESMKRYQQQWGSVYS